MTHHTSITYIRRTLFLHLPHPHPACTMSSYYSISPVPIGLMSSARTSTSYLRPCTAASSLPHVPPFSPALPTVSRPHMKHASLMVPHHLDLISASSYSSQSGPGCMCPPFAPALHHSIKATDGTRKPAILIAVCCPAYSTTFPIPAYSLQLNSSAAL